MDRPRTRFECGPRDIGRAIAVGCLGLAGVRLGAVHVSPRRAVDDDVRTCGAHCFPHRLGVTDVELRVRQSHRLMRGGRGRAHDVLPEHSGRSRDQDSHGLGRPRQRVTLSRSR